jgi:hypothetical protein
VCGSKKRKAREREAERGERSEREEEEEVLGDVLSDPHHRSIDR